MKKIFTISMMLAATFTMYADPTTWTVNKTEAVTSTASETEGTLSYCLANAADGDIITFDNALSGATIEFNAQTKIINKSLTLDASQLNAPVAFDGKENTSLFELGDYNTRNTNSFTIAFKNIIFKNGKRNVKDKAGVIDVYVKNTIFNKCQFVNNKSISTETGRQPGVLRNACTIGKVEFTDCIFKNNQGGRQGGALSIDACGLKIDRCLFEDNTAGDCGSAIDMKSPKTANADKPIVEIYNTTFTGGLCTMDGDGIVISNGHTAATGSPIKIVNCTFVNNKNTAVSNKSTIYSAFKSIEISNSLFGGNKCKDGQNANDVKVNDGSDKETITSGGYNVVYGMTDKTTKSDPDSPLTETDIKYQSWSNIPLAVYNTEKGICEPTTDDPDLWKTLKVIPADKLPAVDQTGAARSSRLGYIGAYEYPSYVLEIIDDQDHSTPAAGKHLYAKDAIVILSNTQSVISWKENGSALSSAAVIMDKDHTVTADYSTSGINDSKEQTGIYASAGYLYVNGYPGATFTVYSTTGALLSSRIIDGDQVKINTNELGKGNLLIVVNTTDGKIATQKIIR